MGLFEGGVKVGFCGGPGTFVLAVFPEVIFLDHGVWTDFCPCFRLGGGLLLEISSSVKSSEGRCGRIMDLVGLMV